MKIIRFFSSASRRIARLTPLVIPKTNVGLLTPPAADSARPQASTSTATPAPKTTGTSSKRRALLIGIQNKPPEDIVPRDKKPKAKGKMVHRLSMLQPQPKIDSNELKGCHKDVREMKQILIDLYGYKEEDIIVLMDTDEEDRILPTQENILKHMRLLVDDAKPGDTFFLHFSGHSTQEETDDMDEEDGMDEFLVTYDDKLVKDDILRSILVDPLPVGARLITVFDTCHSASLLDLKHTRCNRVYVPWINKGRRRSNTKWNHIVRKHAQVPMSPVPGPSLQSPRATDSRKPPRAALRKPKRSQRLESPISKSQSGGKFPRAVSPPLEQLPEDIAVNGPQQRHSQPQRKATSLSFRSLRDRDSRTPIGGDARWFTHPTYMGGSPIVQCDSPEGMFCEGWCGVDEYGDSKYPDVISLSAAKDGERAWEDDKGSSMTQSLVAILRKNPNPTLHDLLLDVSHDLHRLYLGIHARSRDYKKRARVANLKRKARGLLMKTTAEVEMDNFQNPQISSLYPLNTKCKRWSP